MLLFLVTISLALPSHDPGQGPAVASSDLNEEDSRLQSVMSWSAEFPGSHTDTVVAGHPERQKESSVGWIIICRVDTSPYNRFLACKEATALGTQSHLLRAFLASHCVFIAQEGWCSNTMISTNQRRVSGGVWTNERGPFWVRPTLTVALPSLLSPGLARDLP